MDDSPPLLLSLCTPPLEWESADIESEKERTPGEDMEAGEVTMQMQEYIYLGTTPMYFLGASGRIVGGESNPHTIACCPLSYYTRPRSSFIFLARHPLHPPVPLPL